MIKRDLEEPIASFFLFGPRSTGKSTWLYEKFPEAKWFNLLLDDDFLSLSQDSKLFIQAVQDLNKTWIVIDEVQKLPNLLNSIHYLLTKYPGKYNFAISGSSARKLKRLEANLLAGRVIEKKFFPLTCHELKERFNLEIALDVGLLPLIYTDLELARERLSAYVNTYLKEEIQQEALVQDTPGFSRFLRAAAILNGTIINYSNVSRDALLKRQIVQKYFSILIDTLIAFWLPAWQAKATVKEVAKPKFYFFDPGVVRACTQRVGVPFGIEEYGHLFETYILHEVRAYLNYSNLGGELSYWNGGSGTEVDLIWSYGDIHIGIEIKSSKTWKNSFSRGLKLLLAKNKINKSFAVYTGEHSITVDNIKVLSHADFIKKLYAGEILSLK